MNGVTWHERLLNGCIPDKGGSRGRGANGNGFLFWNLVTHLVDSDRR